MTVTEPRVLENPPRTTGNPQQDLPLLIDWFWRAYLIIRQSVLYVTDQNTNIESNSERITQAEADIDDLETIMGYMIRGEVTVSDTNNAFNVTFSTELPDTDYTVFAQVKGSSGTPTAESFIVAEKTYNTTGFSVTLLDAPGAGDTVTYDWQLIKNEAD